MKFWSLLVRDYLLQVDHQFLPHLRTDRMLLPLDHAWPSSCAWLSALRGDHPRWQSHLEQILTIQHSKNFVFSEQSVQILRPTVLIAVVGKCDWWHKRNSLLQVQLPWRLQIWYLGILPVCGTCSYWKEILNWFAFSTRHSLVEYGFKVLDCSCLFLISQPFVAHDELHLPRISIVLPITFPFAFILLIWFTTSQLDHLFVQLVLLGQFMAYWL